VRGRERGRDREGERGLLEARDLQTDKNHSFELDFFRTRLAEADRGRGDGALVMMLCYECEMARQDGMLLN
jgi:hypothetical protein